MYVPTNIAVVATVKSLIKVAGTAVVMKESIKEQPCVWALTALSIATVVKLIYDIGYAMGQEIGRASCRERVSSTV